MIIKPGDKIHVMTRRSFDNDIRRHFIGKVTQASDVAVLVCGYVFVYEQVKSQYVRRPGHRYRVIAIADSGNIINVLPETVNIDKIIYTISEEKRLVVTDGISFNLDINEFRAI